MLIARRVLVSGRVQGVGFRYFAQETALLEGISGWVRNLPDGRVEAFLEGDQEAVDRVERRLRRGPRGARIEQFETAEDFPIGRKSDFVVRS